jgi:hypothetical protein
MPPGGAACEGLRLSQVDPVHIRRVRTERGRLVEMILDKVK